LIGSLEFPYLSFSYDATAPTVEQFVTLGERKSLPPRPLGPWLGEGGGGREWGDNVDGNVNHKRTEHVQSLSIWQGFLLQNPFI
jgi:hypothetical protein